MDVVAELEGVAERLNALTALPVAERYWRLREIREDVKALARELQARWARLGDDLAGLWELEALMTRVLGEEV